MSSVSNQTQTRRRVRYGLNAVVASAAVLALVVLVNWIAHRQFVRFDLTATRRYSLSPQTRKVLDDLRGQYRLVTLFSRGGIFVDQARDLVEEYSRYGTTITGEQIDPVRDLGRMEALYSGLRARYQPQLEGLERVLRDGREALHRVRQAASTMLTPLRAVLEDPALTDQELKLFTQSVAAAFARFGSDIDAVDKQIVETLKDPLPRFSQARDALQDFLVDVDQKVFAVAADRFARAAEDGLNGVAVADNLLAITQHLGQVRSDIAVAASALKDVTEVEDYTKLVGQLQNPEAVVIIGPQQVRVVSLGEMFRGPDPNDIPPGGGQPELRFQGEEKMTGALISMNLEHRPMIVFVNRGRLQALGNRGVFEHVAQRLRNFNFDLSQWSPTAPGGPMGQSAPAPPPQPDPGQKAVWILLPADAPTGPSAAGANGDQAIADLFEKRLSEGDAALVMLGVNPMARFGGVDPILEWLSTRGISPQTDRLILRRVVLPDHQHRASTQLNVDQWPIEMPITRALAGMSAVFVQASPLTLGSGDGPQVSLWPLVQVSGEDLWAERDLTSDANPELDPATAGGPFVIAAAAQRGQERLVVVADPAWASDQVTRLGPQGLPAEIFGAAFPANAELFVNSVFWLASLDQLIAASSRSQDIRRVEPMTPGSLMALRWALLLGMPLAVTLAGVGVWLSRRRC